MKDSLDECEHGFSLFYNRISFIGLNPSGRATTKQNEKLIWKYTVCIRDCGLTKVKEASLLLSGQF